MSLFMVILERSSTSLFLPPEAYTEDCTFGILRKRLLSGTLRQLLTHTEEAARSPRASAHRKSSELRGARGAMPTGHGAMEHGAHGMDYGTDDGRPTTDDSSMHLRTYALRPTHRCTAAPCTEHGRASR